MANAICRAATVLDIRSMISMMDTLCKKDIMAFKSDKDTYPFSVAVITQSLANPNTGVFVVEHNKGLRGFFILNAVQKEDQKKDTKICNISFAYMKKNPIYIKRLIRIARAWGKSKGCTCMTAEISLANERTFKLAQILGLMPKRLIAEGDI